MLENVRKSNSSEVRQLPVYQSSNASSSMDISPRSVAVFAQADSSDWSNNHGFLRNHVKQCAGINVYLWVDCEWELMSTGPFIPAYCWIAQHVQICTCSRCMLSAPALLPVISTNSQSGWKPTNDAYREASGPLTGFDGNWFWQILQK